MVPLFEWPPLGDPYPPPYPPPNIPGSLNPGIPKPGPDPKKLPPLPLPPPLEGLLPLDVGSDRVAPARDEMVVMMRSVRRKVAFVALMLFMVLVFVFLLDLLLCIFTRNVVV